MFSLILIPAKCFSSFIIMWLNRSKNIFSKYFYVLPIQLWIWSNISNSYFTILWYNVVSFSWKPERLIVLSWLQSRQPPKKTINTNMMDVNAKQRWLQGDWFSSSWLSQKGWLQSKPISLLQKPSMFHTYCMFLIDMCPYTFHEAIWPNPQTYILLDLQCVILVMRNICLVSGGRRSAGVWPFHRIS